MIEGALTTESESSLSLNPHLFPGERELLLEWFGRTSFLLEFGCGGSTVLAATAGVKKIISVDSSREWLDRVASAYELHNKDFQPFYVDIGQTGAWGTPLDFAKEKSWPAYYLTVWKDLEQIPDLVFVDGRFRVACALQALIAGGAKTRVAFHDFWPRSEYHEVLNYVDCIGKAASLAVFEAKENLDWKRLLEALNFYACDFR